MMLLPLGGCPDPLGGGEPTPYTSCSSAPSSGQEGRGGGQRQATPRSPKPCSAQNSGGYLPALTGLSSGPNPSPEPGLMSQQYPSRKNCTGPLDLESFCFLFPHISGVGVFSKTQTHLLTKREKKLGEQGARGQRSDPSSQRTMPGSLFPGARAQRVPQAAARGI